MGTTRAVDGVTLSVAAGEFVALVGPSGSGKTSLLAMLATLLTPTQGTGNYPEDRAVEIGKFTIGAASDVCR